jgi:hypothetical protein
MLIGTTTLTAYSQTVVSNDKLDWLFERNDDANYYEHIFRVCDSVNDGYALILDNQDSLILSMDNRLLVNDSLIIKLFNNLEDEQAKAAKAKQKSKFYLTLTAIVAFFIGLNA